MMETIIELTPLEEIGKGVAAICPHSVAIEVSGICGAMKAWLIGGEAVPIGNLVDGKLKKQIDTTGHSGILITRSGRQTFIGMYNEEKYEKELPFMLQGYNWKRVTDKNYANICRELRYIISNTSVYRNFKKYGYYWIGESDTGNAVALECRENEPDPFEFLGKVKLSKNGYVIVCVDKKTNKLYIPKQ